MIEIEVGQKFQIEPYPDGEYVIVEVLDLNDSHSGIMIGKFTCSCGSKWIEPTNIEWVVNHGVLQ